MTNGHENLENRIIGRLVADIWDRIPPISDEMLVSIARSATASPRPIQARAARGAGPARRRLSLRWAVALATTAVLAGSAFGFGLASSLTPSGSAGVNFVGFGFRPLQGWNVMQTGTLDRSGSATAVAANVQLGASDGLRGVPRERIRSLPAWGVLIFATFTRRGDPAQDAEYVVRELPLRLKDAERLPITSDRLGRIARYRLHAGAGGYNIDVFVHFGQREPSAQALASAEEQLSRLVVANERVTIRVQPPVVGPGGRVTVSGSVDGGRAGETVTIQGKTCGTTFFRVVSGAVTRDDGTWSTVYFPTSLTSLRAVWRDETSAQVTIRKRAQIRIRQRSTRKIEVEALGKSTFWRKRAVIQRFDNRLGTWSTIKSVILTESGGGGVPGASATFTLPVPRGTLVRAVFPRSQAAPCYLPGVSNSLRT